jgi:hypothetical protein
MASKQYAYYLEGNRIAIVEKDVSFDNNVANKDYGPGVSRHRWESPKSDVTDGLEVKYVYSPTYRITETNNTFTDLISYKSIAGKLSLKGASNYDSTMDVGDYIVLTNAGKFNGLHKITAFANSGGTNNQINLNTNYDGSTSFVAFEETVTLYYTVSILEDESFELDLPLYLQKALVYYVKGKLAEEQGNIEARVLFMREFSKIMEKYENSRISGLRITSPGPHSII